MQEKLERYLAFAKTLRRIHEATDGAATHLLQESVIDDGGESLWGDESFFEITGEDGQKYLVGAHGLYQEAAKVIEDLVKAVKERAS